MKIFEGGLSDLDAIGKKDTDPDTRSSAEDYNFNIFDIVQEADRLATVGMPSTLFLPRKWDAETVGQIIALTEVSSLPSP